MNETSTFLNTQPSTSTARPFGESFTLWIENIWDSAFGQKEARERAELAAKTRTELQDLAQESKKTPKVIRDLAEARKDILKSTTKIPEGHALIRLRDPKGKFHEITYDPRERSKSGFTFELDDYTVGFTPVGEMNGYNTHFAVRANPKNLFALSEEWQTVALRYPIRTPEFQTLEEERLAATSKIAELKAIQKSRAQELTTIDNGPKSEKVIAHVNRIRHIASLRTRIEIDNEVIHLQESNLERVNQAISKLKSKYTEMVYSPYSSFFNTPEIRGAGFVYLKDTIGRTWKEETRARHILKGIDVREGISGIEARTAIDPRIGMVLAMVERMDFVPYLKRYNPKNQSGELKDPSTVEAMMGEQLERALTTLGVNGENTYKYQRNRRTQAAGISQITPTGQEHMLKRYGSSLLPVNDYIPDHAIAPSDPVQSLRFMQVHLIDQISMQLPGASVKAQWSKIMANESTRLGMYGLLAAGYNGSMSRVVGEALGEKASQQSPEAIFEKLRLPNVIKNVGGNMETLTYVMKFAFVWKYLETKYPQEFKAQTVQKPTK